MGAEIVTERLKNGVLMVLKCWAKVLNSACNTKYSWNMKKLYSLSVVVVSFLFLFAPASFDLSAHEPVTGGTREGMLTGTVARKVSASVAGRGGTLRWGVIAGKECVAEHGAVIWTVSASVAEQGVVAGQGSALAQGAFENFPLPENPDTLRILAIGNSFSDDGTEYLPDLLRTAGIHNVTVARLYIGGCSLERHCNEYASGAENYKYSKAKNGVWAVVSEHCSLRDGIKDEPWDIITMQETSGLSGIYDNYREWLPKLIEIVRNEATNPHASIVWHETWAYAVNSDHERFPLYDRSQAKMWNGIQSCVENLKKDFNIDVVIPSGKAIQLARETSLNNKNKVPDACKVYDLTRDGYHLNRQYGRYIAACTWFETLIKPTLGISVEGNEYVLEDTEYHISKKEARQCQKIAMEAVR